MLYGATNETIGSAHQWNNNLRDDITSRLAWLSAATDQWPLEQLEMGIRPEGRLFVADPFCVLPPFARLPLQYPPALACLIVPPFVRR